METNATTTEPAANQYDHRPLFDANGIHYGYNSPPSEDSEVEGAPMRIQSLCGDALRVVLTLTATDPLDPERGFCIRDPAGLFERLRPAFRTARLPICLANDLPALRVERTAKDQRVRVEVLVPMGKPLAERVGRLRELVAPLGFSMNG